MSQIKTRVLWAIYATSYRVKLGFIENISKIIVYKMRVT